MKLSCYGENYSAKAKECQICDFAIGCWKKHTDSPKRSVNTSGYTIAIMTIIRESEFATVDCIKKEMDKRFHGKDLNIYYYLSVLKKQGLIDVAIKGRQRLYSLR